LIASVIAAGIAIPVLGDADALASALSDLASGNIGGAVVDTVSVVLPNIPGLESADEVIETANDWDNVGNIFRPNNNLWDGFDVEYGYYRIDRDTGDVIFQDGRVVASEDAGNFIGARGGGSSSLSNITVTLGLEDYLETFTDSIPNGVNWKSWASEDLLNWRSYFIQVMSDETNVIAFNLTGIDNVQSSVLRASAGRGGATDWELMMNTVSSTTAV
jgi:hypothetical protein